MKQEKNLTGIEFMHYTSLYACIKRMPNFTHIYTLAQKTVSFPTQVQNFLAKIRSHFIGN